MSIIAKLRALPPPDRRLLRNAWLAILATRLALWVLPFRTVHRLAARAGRRAPTAGTHTPDRLGWAVRAAARRVPGATCLTQALAAQILLGRRGHPARLHIGVAGAGNRPRRELEAHAWTESDGTILVGAAEAARYTPLWTSELD